MRYESIGFLIHPTGYALLFLISYTLRHLNKARCHQCFYPNVDLYKVHPLTQ